MRCHIQIYFQMFTLSFFSEELPGNEVSFFGMGESLTIVSPNYPDKYPNSADILWLVSGPEDYQVVAKFHTFDLEHVESGFDFLSVGSGLNASDQASQMVQLSGSDLPDDVVSINNEMWLNFASDFSFRGGGFWIEITVFGQGNLTGEFYISFFKLNKISLVWSTGVKPACLVTVNL